MTMALRGVKVVEMAGLAPAPFAGMILAGKTVASCLIASLATHPQTFSTYYSTVS